MRIYAELWAKLVNKEEASILCHPSAVARINKGMQKEKWLNLRGRKATDLVSCGRMKMKSEPTGLPNRVKVTFELTYSGDNL